MFENIKKKWARFNADWKAYMDLRYLCRVFESELITSRNKIISYHITSDDTNVMPACIRVHFSAVPNLDANHNFTPYYTMRYCEKFNQHVCAPCMNQNCEFYKRNKDYNKKKARYDSVKNIKNCFWKNIMSHTK